MPDSNTLAVCSWSLQPAGAADLVEKVRETGLNRVQLHLDPVAAGEAGWADMATILSDAGIELASGMVGCVGEDYSSIATIERTGGVVPDATWPQTRERFLAAVPLIERLGLKLVTFHAGFIPHDAAGGLRAKVIDRLTDAADLFSAVGCATALETGQESADVLLGLLQEIGRDDLGVNFDPANMILYGSGEPVDALRRLMPFVRQVHVKDAVASDAPGEKWGNEVAVGRGEVKWADFFEVLAHHGYRGDLCIEREAGEDRLSDVRAAVDLVRGQS